jgi:flagellar hook-basal body complex protein FliE
MIEAAQLQRASANALQGPPDEGDGLPDLQEATTGPTDEGDGLPDLQEATDGPSFGETLERKINQVDQSQETVNEKVSAFVAGEEQNLHEVMISMNQAKLQFELMSEVRNRGLEAFQKLMQTRI